MPVQVRQIGSVEPVAVIAVKAQIGGELTKVLFHEGDDVRAGQQLFEIDPRPWQQAIDQAQAAIAKDQALIAQAQANLARDTVQTSNAKEQADRYAAMAKEGLISADQNSTYQTTFNAQNEALRADEAAINSAKASLNVDKAALETAKLNLAYCSIDSPIDGRAGGLLVQAGNLVKANDTTALVNINQIEPVYVTFSVPEQLLGEIRSDSKGNSLAVTAVVSPEHSSIGHMTFIDNLVDNTTGTIKLKAEFPNADRALWPGQFVNVVMTLRTLHGVTVIPSEAIQSGQQGQFVFVLKPDQTVENRIVKPGQMVENRIVVESGIAPGETVITDGQMRLIPGAPVRVVPAVGQAAAERKRNVLMNISHFFIQRPIFTTLTAFGILLFGIVGYRALPVAALPSVDYPTIQVNAGLPGASPETMAASVATPLERQFSTIAGIDSMNSSSSLGSTSITIQFTLDRNIDAAAQDVASAISKAGGLLPPNMPRPPSFSKVNPADQPIFFLGVSSDTLPVYTVDEYAETVMAQQISTVSGVSQVSVFGGQKYAVRIQLDPDALASRGIGVDEVQAAIGQNNSNIPTGKLYGSKQAFTIQSSGQLTNAAQFRRMIVAYRNGNPVRLDELGTVLDGVENDKVGAWLNDARTIILAINRQPGTNTVEVVDNVKRLLPTFRAAIPPSIKLGVIFDRSIDIRNSIDDVKFTLLLTVCLVVMVIFLFLRNISATLIPGVAVPLSIIGTFAVMYLLGYSLNNLSLMALTLSVGFVVDDAIVMLENIVRHMERGESRMQAALRGSREIGFTIVSMTISLVSVFIPVLFMGGIVGRLLHEFSVTIAVAILVSGFVSLTLTPMLGSKFLRFDTRQERHGIFYNALERCFQAMNHLVTSSSLLFVLRHRFRHPRARVRAAGRERLALHGYAQRLPAQRRQRVSQRHCARRPGHFLRLHGGARPRGQEHHAARSQQRQRVRFCRRRQPGPGFHDAERPQRSPSFRRPGDPGTAAEASLNPRYSSVSAESAAHPDRGQQLAEPLPAHSAGFGSE